MAYINSQLNFVEGYKVFNSDFTTFNGLKFHVGEHKHVDGDVKAGAYGGLGFHMCKNFYDCFRWLNPENPILCEVIGFGQISEYCEIMVDNGYYDIYACSDIYIKRIVPREEIIEMAKKLHGFALEKLVKTYSMTDEEIAIIENNLNAYTKYIKKYIDYHHRGNKHAFDVN